MKNLLVSIAASAVITIGMIWGYDQNFAVKIAVIDMDGYVSLLKTDYTQGKLSKEALDADLQRLSRQIQEKYSSNTILLLNEVVVSGNVASFDPDSQSE
ncbi:MAG: hypothetical protein COX19_06720 [Desulfobacterales bacterium CG23_combo_of_CG06-09_8_20_14_all_51_8]|nr:MAG: hypothetical protein COX19_06720 [Desulfobacterales bacterium CG23_combo_of_CG06-09_8_20_14_all_51_8]